MRKSKKDLFIKEKLQKDKNISNLSKETFQNFKENLNIREQKKEKVLITISLKRVLAICACLIIVGFVGINLYANSIGKTNVISEIQALIKHRDKTIDQNQNEEEKEKQEKEIETKQSINKISKEEAYNIIKNKYYSSIEEITYTEKNVKENKIEYYSFRRERVNADGTKKYLSTILISLDGNTIKEIYDPEGLKEEKITYTEEQQKEIKEDKYNQQAKEAINKYFELIAEDSPDELLLKIEFISSLKELIVPEEEKVHDEQQHLNYKKTNIEYDAFRNKLLEYMTENMFNQFIHNHIDTWYKNIDGILWIADYRAEGTNYYVYELELVSIHENTYEYFVKYKEEGGSQVAVKTMYLEIKNGRARISNTDM